MVREVDENASAFAWFVAVLSEDVLSVSSSLLLMMLDLASCGGVDSGGGVSDDGDVGGGDVDC